MYLQDSSSSSSSSSSNNRVTMEPPVALLLTSWNPKVQCRDHKDKDPPTEIQACFCESLYEAVSMKTVQRHKIW
jgi:hypothetical protein